MNATVRPTGEVMLTPAQVRAARGLLDWSQPELARQSGVHPNTINTFERERTDPVRSTLLALEKAFRRAGVEFIDADDRKGPGVRLRSPQ